MKRLFLWLVLCAAIASQARGEIIYVNCSATAVGGDGSSGSPYRDVYTALEVAQPGDVIYVNGNCREQVLTIDDNNITIRSNPSTVGTTPARISGNSTSPSNGTVLWKTDFDADGDIEADDLAAAVAKWAETSWAKTAGSTTNEYFEIDISNIAAADIASVTINWETQVDVYGRHYGHLIAADGVTTGTIQVDDTDGSYYLDTSGTPERLYVNPTGDVGGSMTGKTVRIVRQNEALNATEKDGITLERIDFGPNCENSATNNAGGASWNVLFVGGSNITVDRCRFYDCGRHNFGWTSAGASNARNNVVKNCLFAGARYSDNTLFVAQTGTGGVIDDMLLENCTAMCYGRLNESGVEMDTIAAYRGFYAHGASNNIHGITLNKCKVIGFSGTTINVQPFGFEDTAVAADYKNFDTYPIKLIECETTGCESILATGGSVAMRYCRFNSEDYADSASFGLNSATCSGIYPTSINANIFLESSIIVTNTDHGTADTCVVNWAGDLFFNNNTIIDYNDDTNVTSNYEGFVRALTDDQRFCCYQTVWQCVDRTTGVPAAARIGFIMGFTAGGSIVEVDFKRNGYVGITSPGLPAVMGGNADFDTWTEFASSGASDTAEGTESISSGYVSDVWPSANLDIRWSSVYPETGELIPGTFFSTYRNPRTNFLPLPEGGINGQEYYGNYGAYQFGDEIEFGGGNTNIRNRSRP